MQPLEIFVDDETKLTLHGLQQHYVKLEETAKNRKLNELLDTLEFNQVLRNSCRPVYYLTGYHSGRHLCQIRCSCHRVGQAPGVLQLPKYQHPFWSATGREVWLSCDQCFSIQLHLTESTDTQPSRPLRSGYLWLPIFLGVVSMLSVSISWSTMTARPTQTATFIVLGVFTYHFSITFADCAALVALAVLVPRVWPLPSNPQKVTNKSWLQSSPDLKSLFPSCLIISILPPTVSRISLTFCTVYLMLV